MKKYVNSMKRMLMSLCLMMAFVCSSSTVYAATRNLNVSSPTQEEIIQYIQAHTAQSECPLSYSVEPTITAPYSAGILSAATLQLGLDSLNEVRYIAGLNSNVTLDDEYNELCQAGTLLNAVNGELTHYPTQPNDMDDSLFDLGYEGASHSNIGEDFNLDRTLKHTMIHGWMADEDSGNIAQVGHRRWCLNPSMGKTGFGVVVGMDSRYGAEAVFSSMYSMDSSYDASVSTVVWPAQNMPTDYFDGSYPWSISSDDAFSNDVKVVLTYMDGDADASNDQTWEFSSASADGYFNYDKIGYGQQHCLIFRPNGISTYYDGDQYMVQVIEEGTVTLEYTVNFFDLEPIPEDVTLSLSKKYGSMELIQDGMYWSALSIAISDSTISTDRIRISTSDESVADAMLGKNNNGRTTVFIKTVTDGVAQITFELAKNIKAVYKVTVGDGGGHVHDNIEVDVEEATCTETGLRYLECDGCGVPSTEEIPTIDHDYDDGVVTKEPTCMTKGERTFTCGMCEGTTTEDIETVDHEYETSYTIDKEPTCKEEGSQSYHCIWYEECGVSEGTTSIDKTDNHDYDEGVVTVEPTCMTVGEKTFTCSVCEGTITEEMSIVDHEYETTYTIDQEPSCKEEGSQSYHCVWYSKCGESTGTTTVEKTEDHDYDEGVVTKEPTCTTVGERTFTCTICEGTKVEDEPTVDHEYETTYTVDKEPSCKEKGSKSYHCIWYEECGSGAQVTAIDKTNDHNYDNGIVTKEPTCSTTGEKTFTCAICEGTRVEVVDKVSHSYAKDFTVDVEATCVSEGSKSRHCVWYELCEESTEATVIDINDNHSFDEGEVTTPSSCTKEGVRTFTCVRCPKTKTEPEPLKPHSYDEGVVTKTPTCTVEGEKTFTCEECKGTKVEPVEMVAHEYDTDFTVDKEATCTSNGSKSRHCKTCDSKIDTTVILAPGHVVGDWIIDKEASYAEAGSRHKECSVCHTVTEREDISKLVAQNGATVAVGNDNYSVSSTSAGKQEVIYAGPQDKTVVTVDIPSTIQIGTSTYKVTTISANAFANCENLTTVKLGKNITKIGKNAFSGCTKLNKVTLPSKLVTIESGAFANCTSLKSITIPSSVKKIGAKAFYKCKKLTKITIKTSKLKSSTVGKNAFSGVHKKVKVKVPKKKLNTYKKFLKKKGLPKKATIKK